MLELPGLCLACAIPNKATIIKIGFNDRSVNRTSNGNEFTCVWKMTRSLFPNVQTNNISDPVTRRSQNRERSRRPETVLSGGASLKCWKKKLFKKWKAKTFLGDKTLRLTFGLLICSSTEDAIKNARYVFWEIKCWGWLWLCSSQTH